MPSSGIWRSDGLERTDVSEERSASIIMVFLRRANVVPNPPILVTLMMEAVRSSVLKKGQTA
jgi:hypothetical protein